MKRSNCISVFFVTTMLFEGSVWASVDADSGWSEVTIESMMAFHRLDRQAAVDRLVAEAEAADIYRKIRDLELEGYAGSWFDSETGTLQVALSSVAQKDLVEAFGGVVRSAAWSLADLEAVKERVRRVGDRYPGLVRELGVDVRLNQVRAGVASGSARTAESVLSAIGPEVFVVEVAGEAGFSSDTVWGGYPTRNYTWDPTGNHPCSVGASTDGGFLTAGHCGFLEDDIRTPALWELGTVKYSSFAWGPQAIKDAGWVEVVSGWNPQPEIRGAGTNVWPVPAKWSGTNESPVGSTVCRFGGTSMGPHCGEIVLKDFEMTLSGQKVEGLTVVEGSCTDDGDSGGPHIALAGYQIQGINVGGLPTNSCPVSPSNIVYFQPINQVIGLVTGGSGGEKPMKTTHGDAVPTPVTLLCPNMSSSGDGFFWCDFQHYNSQGVTSINWSSSTGSHSTSTFVFGHCVPGHPVTVDLSLGNPYGDHNQAINFACPSDIIP